MRIIHTFLLVGLIAGGVGCSNSSAQQLYVSPNQGNDNWSGTRAKPNSDKTDGPIASVKKAVELVKLIRSRNNKNSKDTIYVNLDSGIHTLQDVLVFGADHETMNDNFIIFQSTGPGKAIISGAKRIPIKPDPNRINKISLADVKAGQLFFEQLYQDGHSLQRAREPNDGFFYMNDVREDTLQRSQQARAPATLSTYAIANDKVASDEFNKLKRLPPQSLQQVLITIPYKWNVVKRYVSNLDSRSKRIVTQKGHGMGDFVQWSKGMQFYMENALAFLDSPGEWYLDKKDGILYYWPSSKSTETRGEVTLDAPVLETLISFKGKGVNQKVRNIIFRNLAFEHSALYTPKAGFVAQQTSPFINAAIMADFAENLVFENCEFRNMGNNAVWLKSSCSNSQLTNNYFHNIGASAIKIGDYKRPLKTPATENITIDNNIIKSCGQLIYSAPGVAIYLAANNKVTHNEISDIKYSGISNGYTWRDTETPNRNNYFAFNYIHHLGWGVMDDLGGIYTVGHSENTIIENNVIHDVHCYRYSGFGIYLDEGSEGITVRNNLVYNCQSAGFMCSYAKRDLVTNNIFAFNKDAQLYFNYPPNGDASKFKFKNNIIVGEGGKLYNGKLDNIALESDSNCYWFTKGNNEIAFNGMSLGRWRVQASKDQHSIVQNPHFVDPQQNNFSLKSIDIAKKINFVSFDVSKAGVYGREEWKQKASLPSAIIDSFQQRVRNKGAK